MVISPQSPSSEDVPVTAVIPVHTFFFIQVLDLDKFLFSSKLKQCHQRRNSRELTLWSTCWAGRAANVHVCCVKFLHKPRLLCHLCGLLWLLSPGEAQGVSHMALCGFFYRLRDQCTYLWCYVHSLRAIVTTPSLGHPRSGGIFQLSLASKARCLSFLLTVAPPKKARRWQLGPSNHPSIHPFSIPASSCTQGL